MVSQKYLSQLRGGFLQNVKLFGFDQVRLPANFSEQKLIESNSIFSENNVDKRSLLGLNFLMQFDNFCIDGRGLSLNVEQCTAIQVWQPMELLPILSLVVKIKLDGIPYRMLIDTGASSNFINIEQLTNAKVQALGPTTERKQVKGAFNLLNLTTQAAPFNLDFGNTIYQTKYNVIHDKGLFFKDYYDGLLGLYFFDSFESVMFDFKNMRLGLGKRRTKPFVLPK